MPPGSYLALSSYPCAMLFESECISQGALGIVRSNESTDLTSTLGSSRNPTDPEVTTEPINENRCQRPLQRARERRDARLQKERDAHAVINSDPHDPGSQRSRVSRDLEQDRSQLKCDRCNNRLTDLDWSKIKSNGWDAEIVEHAPFCSNCIDHWRVL